MRSRLSAYYSLTKPSVLYGNVITGIAGFLLAAQHFHRFSPSLFLATIIGMTLIIASACTLNNYLDQDIDSLMDRTKKRAIVSGEVSGKNAVILSLILGFLGIGILSLWVSWLVVGIGIFGFVTYVWLYGALSKRLSIHGTIVGSISGAMPILAGYVAVANKFDIASILLFLALFFWQFPEFYSISIYRKKEYAIAKIPVMSVIKGIESTKKQIFIYTVLYVISTLLLTITGYTGWIYFVVMALSGAHWIYIAYRGFNTKNTNAWARKMFHLSLIELFLISLMVSIGALIP
jgi:protoheme IX farnesyltransferase